MQVAVFGSGSGTTLRAMLTYQKLTRDPPFEIKVLFTDRICNFQNIAKEENLPLIYHPLKDQKKYPSRLEYDQDGVKLLQKYYPIDILLFAGYMQIATAFWLNAFPYRIVNIHPADLTLQNTNGTRKFVGKDAVFDALENGQTKTRSTAILIDENVDTGPILALGPWTIYQGNYPINKMDVQAHQEKQKAISDWPVCLTALLLIAQGKVEVDPRLKQIWIDGKLQNKPADLEYFKGIQKICVESLELLPKVLSPS